MFRKEKVMLIQNALSQEMVKFLNLYFRTKEETATTLKKTGYVPPQALEWGTPGDAQVPGSFSIYGDQAGDTVLQILQPITEKATQLKLLPTYSYCRVYKKGAILAKHTDRFSCDISTSLCLGGDPWAFCYKIGKKNKHIILKPGEMIAYLGSDVQHWREPFEGEECVQLFLHYNSVKSKFAKQNKYDGRPHLGLPSYFTKRINKKGKPD